MAYPAETVDGKTVFITEKGSEGGKELLREGNGNCYYVRNDGKLIPHPNNVPEANLEGFVPDSALAAEVDAADPEPEAQPVGPVIEDVDDEDGVIVPFESEGDDGEEAEAPEAA